jgi:hypothetical protein
MMRVQRIVAHGIGIMLCAIPLEEAAAVCEWDPPPGGRMDCIHDDVPLNDPLWILIGRDPNDGSQWISWQNLTTGECKFDRIGDASGLIGQNGNRPLFVNVHGEYEGDLIETPSVGSSISMCGFENVALTLQWVPVAGNQLNQQRIDLYGHEGDDTIMSHANGGGGFLNGGPDNDYIYTSRADRFIYGGPGHDYIDVDGDESGGRTWETALRRELPATTSSGSMVPAPSSRWHATRARMITGAALGRDRTPAR